MLACHPAAANGKDLSDKAVCRITAQIGSELGIFIGADQTPEWHLALQAILKTRIGLNLGTAFAGNVGSAVRKEYTVMGDAVNLASRIEALTRHYGLDLLVGQATRDAAGGAITWLEVDHVRVKGKQQAVTLFTPVTDALAAAAAYGRMRR